MNQKTLKKNGSQAVDDAARRRGPSEEEVRRVEEERIQVLNNMEELEQKIKELDNQIDESAQEVKRRQSLIWFNNTSKSDICEEK